MKLRSRSTGVAVAVGTPRKKCQLSRRAPAARRGRTKVATQENPAECSDEEDVPVVRRSSIMKARARRKPWPSDNSKGATFHQEEAMNPDQCFFGYSTFSPVNKMEDDNRVFNPYTFIKNIPSQSLLSKPCVREIPLKTRSTPEATLVLDLEETLVYSSLSMIAKASYTFDIHFQDCEYKVYLILRPYVKEFLNRMSKHFEIFVYTSAKKEYAEKILEILDSEKKSFR